MLRSRSHPKLRIFNQEPEPTFLIFKHFTAHINVFTAEREHPPQLSRQSEPEGFQKPRVGTDKKKASSRGFLKSNTNWRYKNYSCDTQIKGIKHFIMDPPNPCKCISVQEWFKNVQLYCYILFSTVPLVAGYRTVLKTEIAMIEQISSNISVSGYGTGKLRYGTGKVGLRYQ